MKIQPSNTTVLCPLNDAESFTIVKIAKRLGFETRISTQNSWFCSLEKEPDHFFSHLKKNVITIEMPGVAREQNLSLNHNVIIIDHHGYPSLKLERENALSSIEQFADMIEYTLDRAEQAVAINDQKYIYGLIDAGYSQQEINEVRKLDLSLQGYTDKEFEILKNDFNSPQISKNGVYTYHSSVKDKFSYLVDLHISSQKNAFSNVIILGKSESPKEEFIFFSGALSVIKKLKKIGGYSKESTPDYGIWGGFKAGIEKVPIKKTIDIILKHSF